MRKYLRIQGCNFVKQYSLDNYLSGVLWCTYSYRTSAIFTKGTLEINISWTIISHLLHVTNLDFVIRLRCGGKRLQCPV